ncbi:MAG TPA: hypothetical protein DCR07_03240 [Lactococcus sp.]|nr:hypothetical protein [Lactococcus sp.]
MIYICNKNADDKGRHEVHVSSCTHRPLPENTLELGYFNSCHEAIKSLEESNKGKEFNFDGCFYRCKPCHHG